MATIKYVVKTDRREFNINLSSTENLSVAKENIIINIKNMGEQVLSIEPAL